MELVERGHQVSHRDVPLRFGDTEPGVGAHHVATDVDAGPTGGGAKLVDDELPQALEGKVLEEPLVAVDSGARVIADRLEMHY